MHETVCVVPSWGLRLRCFCGETHRQTGREETAGAMNAGTPRLVCAWPGKINKQQQHMYLDFWGWGGIFLLGRPENKAWNLVILTQSRTKLEFRTFYPVSWWRATAERSNSTTCQGFPWLQTGSENQDLYILNILIKEKVKMFNGGNSCSYYHYYS